MNIDNLGDWCKWLEKNFSNEIMIPLLPVIIRLDGNNFSSWTKGLEEPYDGNFRDLMVDTTTHLVKRTNAVIGYTQSDEITLILYSDSIKSSIYNDGKKQKILSKLTSTCSNYFNKKRPEYLPNHNKVADFDCRIYQTPTLDDACKQLLWRENDATRNSISTLGRYYFSHESLKNLNSNQIQNLLMTQKSINWNDFESRFKRGVYVQKRTVCRKFTPEEISKLPEKHNARKNPDYEIERSEIVVLDMPIFSTVKNKVDVVFNGFEPKINITNE